MTDTIFQMVKDIQIAENVGLKYMYYNTIRPHIPKSGKVRLPFFGNVKVHKVRREKNGEFNLCVRVTTKTAKKALIGIVQHLSKLDQEATTSIEVS